MTIDEVTRDATATVGKEFDAFDELMAIRGLAAPNPEDVTITGADPVFSTPFKLGEACANVLAAIGVAVTDIHEQQTGDRQSVSIDTRHAAATLRSTSYLYPRLADGTLGPAPASPSMTHMRSITQPWPTKDGRWVLPHFNLPHLRDRVLGVLKCDPTPEAVRKAVAQWDSLDLENAITEARACGAVVRQNDEWLAHPHGAGLAAKPLVEIEKIGDSDPEPLPGGAAPLSGVRVLDLTRILAGPIAGRTLAENGADVLMVTAKHLPQVMEHVRDTSHGKRSTFLDLTDADDAATLKKLAAGADVFSQGFRPGAIASHGFSPEDLAAARPGIIYLTISCYGSTGPFKDRAGWEQLAQTVTGICHDGGETSPALLPASACDYTTGYLGAYGVLLALARRARDGGSYHVRVSLCQSGMYIYRHGKVERPGPDMDLSAAEISDIQSETQTADGVIRHLAPVLKLSATPPRWSRPTPAFGADAPEWLSA
jgi:crotonobetainyl-CoA:carnitine CoA-transferase CaiB-like acyl-CoA transferase